MYLMNPTHIHKNNEDINCRPVCSHLSCWSRDITIYLGPFSGQNVALHASAQWFSNKCFWFCNNSTLTKQKLSSTCLQPPPLKSNSCRHISYPRKECCWLRQCYVVFCSKTAGFHGMFPWCSTSICLCVHVSVAARNKIWARIRFPKPAGTSWEQRYNYHINVQTSDAIEG